MAFDLTHSFSDRSGACLISTCGEKPSATGRHYDDVRNMFGPALDMSELLEDGSAMEDAAFKVDEEAL